LKTFWWYGVEADMKTSFVLLQVNQRIKMVWERFGEKIVELSRRGGKLETKTFEGRRLKQVTDHSNSLDTIYYSNQLIDWEYSKAADSTSPTVEKVRKENLVARRVRLTFTKATFNMAARSSKRTIEAADSDIEECSYKKVSLGVRR